MSKIVFAALLAVLTYSLTGCGQMLPSATPSSTASLKASNMVRFTEGQSTQEILVKFKTSINASSIQTFQARHGLRTLRVIPGLNVHVMTATTTRLPLDQLLVQMNADPLVEYAEINRSVTVSRS